VFNKHSHRMGYFCANLWIFVTVGLLGEFSKLSTYLVSLFLVYRCREEIDYMLNILQSSWVWMVHMFLELT
jgi:hypothetical protein